MAAAAFVVLYLLYLIEREGLIKYIEGIVSYKIDKYTDFLGQEHRSHKHHVK